MTLPVKDRTRELEWLARLVEEIAWDGDATEGESYYQMACALYETTPRKLKIREPDNEDENMKYIKEALL